MFKSFIKRDDDASHISINFCGIKLSARHKGVLLKLKTEVQLRPLRVLFPVTKKQKWGYQSFHNELLTDEHFIPVIAGSCVTRGNGCFKESRGSIEDNIKFFIEEHMKWLQIVA